MSINFVDISKRVRQLPSQYNGFMIRVDSKMIEFNYIYIPNQKFLATFICPPGNSLGGMQKVARPITGSVMTVEFRLKIEGIG